MDKIVIVYHSILGTMESLAHGLKQGIEAVDHESETLLIPILDDDIHQARYHNEAVLKACDDSNAIIFGSPTFMGSVSAQFKAFADASSERWTNNAWQGKVAAGFTIGSNLCGDQSHTIQYMNIFANQHGMLWLSLDIPGGYDQEGRNRLGAQGGLVAHSTDTKIHPTDLQTAHYLGERVGTFVKRLSHSL